MSYPRALKISIDRHKVFTPQYTNPEKQPFGIINGGEVLEGLEIDLSTVFEDIG
ncbi:hypothetical protein [Runella slithyformis]|uniref:hypothetical protein n=1 Tax=Runella slithyformis TaxID=106 RepID=UPI0002D746D9|nr:hypothetical protein [Runella slithyformis]